MIHNKTYLKYAVVNTLRRYSPEGAEESSEFLKDISILIADEILKGATIKQTVITDE